MLRLELLRYKQFHSLDARVFVETYSGSSTVDRDSLFLLDGLVDPFEQLKIRRSFQEQHNCSFSLNAKIISDECRRRRFLISSEVSLAVLFFPLWLCLDSFRSLFADVIVSCQFCHEAFV
jgi:hypothetical protein